MNVLHELISGSTGIAVLALVIAFVILAKSADVFVDSAISIAERFKVPKIIIGIVLVSLGTTAPELTVSLVSSLKGQPEMALGNAVGSVICDDGLALPLCAFMATGAIAIAPGVLKLSGVYLLVIQALACIFILPDARLSRLEGIVLVSLFVVYITHLLISNRTRPSDELLNPTKVDHSQDPIWRLILYFSLSLAALVFASDIIVSSATTIARSLNIPEFIIAVTMVALGTSIPEISTCISAARKGEGALAVGNILGADVLNICWVAGASAIANDLIVEPKNQVYLMVPGMVVIVLVMLAMLKHNYTLTRKKGVVMLCLYVAYLLASFLLFPSA